MSGSAPACGCSTIRREDGYGARIVELPCGCSDVYYANGAVCREHNHVECDGKAKHT